MRNPMQVDKNSNEKAVNHEELLRASLATLDTLALQQLPKSLFRKPDISSKVYTILSASSAGDLRHKLFHSKEFIADFFKFSYPALQEQFLSLMLNDEKIKKEVILANIDYFQAESINFCEKVRASILNLSQHPRTQPNHLDSELVFTTSTQNQENNLLKRKARFKKDELLHQIKRLKTQLSESQTREKSSNEANIKLQESTSQLNQKINKQQKTIDEFKQLINQLETQLKKQKEETDSLKWNGYLREDKLQQQRKQIENLEKKNSKADEKLQQHRLTAEISNHEISQLHESCKNSNSLLEQEKKNTKNLQDQIHILQQKNDQEKRQYSQELIDLKHQKEALQENNQQLTQKIGTQQKELEEKISELREQISTLQQTHEEQKRKQLQEIAAQQEEADAKWYAASTLAMTQLNQQLADKAENVTQLTEQLADKEKNVTQLTEQLEKQKATIQKLQDKKGEKSYAKTRRFFKDNDNRATDPSSLPKAVGLTSSKTIAGPRTRSQTRSSGMHT